MPFKKNDPNINRNGRPKKGESFRDILRTRLDELTNLAGAENMTKAEYLMMVLEQKAAEGDLTAMNMILDRVDGKPTQFVESKNENSLTVEHEIID